MSCENVWVWAEMMCILIAFWPSAVLLKALILGGFFWKDLCFMSMCEHFVLLE